MIRDDKNGRLKASPDIYNLVDIEEGQYYRNIFPYSEIPKVPFNDRFVPMNTPKEVWITDTSFRDGQQARPPYATEHIVQLYKFLNKLGGKNGMIRQTEFFLYSKRDREAIEKCLALDYKFPEITSWVRATKSDFELVKSFGLKETGILTSVSDYHIFKKMKKTRQEILDQYLGIVKDSLEAGIIPRCHFEDITRADFYGFVVPFATELMKLSEEARMPVKIRACDTLGLGVTYPGAALPRSVAGTIYGLREYAGVPSEQLEWHGHNDFYKGTVNAATAWLYGCSSVNCTVLGFGERTGNTPIEAMAIEYAQIFGNTNGMDLSIITEIRNFLETYTNTVIPTNMPFVGKDFNTTRAGIHADGLLKDEEIYNIFDTGKILDRPPEVMITDKSGTAGICAWINVYFNLDKEEEVHKDDPLIKEIYMWVLKEYEEGRITTISDQELIEMVRKYFPDIFNKKVISGNFLKIKSD
ncbi:MAG: 2-isopropylmalate synthase [Spirochaetes bacterium GWC1_27_15]|nr:MAG: 2-isopropylmalate synthase [Spirochaetes bacterium GWB1_27_13]OHD25674.1 MAG: 2-isopropylmalate synthase [Spirochaetes bacterium GWC1_27_15]